MPDPVQTRDLDIRRALARSGGVAETPASNRHRLDRMRSEPKARNGNADGSNGQAVTRFGRSIT